MVPCFCCAAVSGWEDKLTEASEPGAGQSAEGCRPLLRHPADPWAEEIFPHPQMVKLYDGVFSDMKGTFSGIIAIIIRIITCWGLNWSQKTSINSDGTEPAQ